MRLIVLGSYLPRLAPERLTSWVADDVKAFVDEIRELKRRGLAKAWSEEELKARAEDLPEELHSALNSAALFEVLVQEHGGEFDPYSISEKETTAVAWEPAYLSVDGDEPIGAENMTTASSFRVAFYVHEWPERGTLIGPTGVLSLPEFKPVPERLWKLAPYALLD